MADCYHCGLPAVDAFAAPIEGVQRDFCCIGCQSAAFAIVDGGLADFYRYRDKKNSRPVNNTEHSFLAYDLEQVQADFVSLTDEGHSEAVLSVSGISCAACAWLIEQRLSPLEGVVTVSVNVTNYRCRLVWDKSVVALSTLLQSLAEIGYQAEPANVSQAASQRKRESRLALLRLGVAGIGMMQVGMYAIALHAGAMQGMDHYWQQFFRWVSLVVATPVVLYSARPFFSRALLALKSFKLNMDVPVALAIGLAYIASAWATWSGEGEVYFDSVSMFTFFLLLGRFLEMKVRHSSAFVAEKVSHLLPPTVARVSAEGIEQVPLASLQVGDEYWVATGDIIPCDGRVVEGASGVDESMLNGESLPVTKAEGDDVYAGTLNGETRMRIRVTAAGADTRLAAIEALVDRASASRPKAVAVADRVAGYFVLAVLITTAIVGLIWYHVDPSRVLWVCLSVLVATCPCALSLATPAALTAGTLAMRRSGLIVLSGQFIEGLTSVTHAVFDKTGTLTEGNISVARIDTLASASEDEVMETIAALEQQNAHPIARAFQGIAITREASDVKTIPGCGVQGCIDGVLYKFGTAAYACPETEVTYPDAGLWQLLSANDQPLAWILLQDKPRQGIDKLVAYFSQRRVAMSLLSGDRSENCEPFKQQWQLPFIAGASPEKKQEVLSALQAQGSRVLMVGDGINDVPVMRGANLSIAMGGASQLTQAHADAVLTNNRLTALNDVMTLADAVRRKIRQNIMWACGYNLSVLPLAASGILPPYLAAIGMSASSLIVVLNAVSLSKSNMAHRR